MSKHGTALAIASALALAGHCLAAPEVIEGDGINGPKGMVWLPGGEFLMGSDHKLAQPNERR